MTIAEQKTAPLAPATDAHLAPEQETHENPVAPIPTADEPLVPDVAALKAEDKRSRLRHESREAWRARLSRGIAVTDTAIILLAVAVSWWLGLDVEQGIVIRNPIHDLEPRQAVAIAAIMVGWCAALSLFDTRDRRILAGGTAQYSRIVQASFSVFGAIAIISYLLKAEVSRSLVLMAFPLGLILLLLSRRLWRTWIMHRWNQGRMQSRIYLIGSDQSVQAIAYRLLSGDTRGFQIVGAADTRATSSSTRRPLVIRDHVIPRIEYREDVGQHMKELGADTLLVAGGHFDSPWQLRRASWKLDPSTQDLVVAPGIIDVGAPRLAVSPVAGLPLMHVEHGTMNRYSRVIKRTFDIIGSVLLIALTSPFLLLIALIIKLGDGGPVFFRQERVGRNGKKFDMIKFRSMRVDAEEILDKLRSETDADAGNTVLFKMKDDPRVTRVGKFLRRYSIDEVPQLFNVLNGTMSMVGPRPPLEREVTEYASDVHHKFKVKPGMTGLWQVSGRSNLSWDDSVRLDLYYAENWTFMGDLSILVKTLRAVIGSDGAY